MQGDNARTIDDQVVPDEEAKLLLAYYMEGTISKEVYQKNSGNSWRNRKSDIFPNKRRWGKCPMI